MDRETPGLKLVREVVELVEVNYLNCGGARYNGMWGGRTGEDLMEGLTGTRDGARELDGLGRL